MTGAVLLSLVAFSFAMAIKPGPNNLLLATSGLTFGFRRTVPALAGTIVGIAGLVLISGAGIGALVMNLPGAQTWLRAVGAAYLLYLSWRLWRAGDPGDAAAASPLRIWHAAGFQLVNPKAWMMTVSAISIYAAPAERYAEALLLVTVVFLMVGAPCNAVWAGFGAAMRTALTSPGKRKLFNRGMALLTAASAALVLFWS